MNLPFYLLKRIVLAALLSLFAVAFSVLMHSHRQAIRAAEFQAESLSKQLKSQLQLTEAGIGPFNTFPDFEWWKQSGGHAGLCIRYLAEDRSISRSLCNGPEPVKSERPKLFDVLYRHLFDPGREAIATIALNGHKYGVLTVSPAAELELAAAWDRWLDLSALSGVTVVAICLFVYIGLIRALQPVQRIVNGLAEMESGGTVICLPEFRLTEWQRISSAINRLTAAQQQLLSERQKLSQKLIELRDDERRHLAREIHDQFGQYLTAINAVASAIKQSAARQCPELTAEAERIGRMASEMLRCVRDLLGRLHPAELEQLGLAAALDSLTCGWNIQAGNTHYALTIDGDCGLLTTAQAAAVYRVAQEALTNTAKHASARNVTVALCITSGQVVLNVRDDGLADRLPFAESGGIGLLGIRERLNALHGRLNLAIADPHGLILEAGFPIDIP